MLVRVQYALRHNASYRKVMNEPEQYISHATLGNPYLSATRRLDIHHCQQVPGDACNSIYGATTLLGRASAFVQNAWKLHQQQVSGDGIVLEACLHLPGGGRLSRPHLCPRSLERPSNRGQWPRLPDGGNVPGTKMQGTTKPLTKVVTTNPFVYTTRRRPTGVKARRGSLRNMSFARRVGGRTKNVLDPRGCADG